MKRAAKIINWTLVAGFVLLALALVGVMGPVVVIPLVPLIVTLLALDGLGRPWLAYCAIGLNVLLLTFGIFGMVDTSATDDPPYFWGVVIAVVYRAL